MATILQFAERLAEHGDWTPAERSQLRDMSTQLGQGTGGLDLVFGKTEEGDPWCVVADDRSEVLLHVARIQGNFVVHAPRNDQVIESHDLWLAVSRVLGGVLRDRRGVVLPFAPDMMGQPAALALMLAAAVRGDFSEIVQNALPQIAADNDRSQAPALAPQAHSHDAGAAEAARAAGHAEQAHATDQGALTAPVRNGAGAAAVAAALAAAGETQAGPLDGQAAAQAQALAQASDQASGQASGGAAPAPLTAAQQAQLPAPQTQGAGSQHPAAVAGGATTGHEFSGASGAAFAGAAGGGSAAGAANSAGTAAGNGMSGGLGAAAAGGEGTLGNSQGDTVQGGVQGGAGAALPAAAENAVVVQSGAVARGQMGTTDVFVLTAPVRTEGSNVVSLGVVAGFSFAEGDRLVFANGATPAIVQVLDLNPLSAGASGLAGDTVRRIGYDFNGDGHEDAYVLVVDAPQPLELHKAANIGAADIGADDTVTLQGVAAPAAAASITVFFTGP